MKRRDHLSWRLCLLMAMMVSQTSTAVAHPWTPVTSDVVTVAKLQLSDDRRELIQLKLEGYDIAGVDYKNNTVDVILHDQQEALTWGLIGYETRSIRVIDTKNAPDEGYTTYEELTTLVRNFAETYSHIASLESIGKSHEGRDIWALKITDNPTERELEEPTILFNAMHHAREVMTTEVALDTIEYLLTNYGRDEDVNHWVDNNEIWVVPMVNPDGNNKVWTESSMWRKNTYDGYGVDLNRNYPFGWNSCNGSSGSKWSHTYRGPSPASEPETQSLMGLVSRIQPIFDISYHSYSELVIYPYGCGQNHAQDAMVRTTGEELAALLPSDSDRGAYDVGTAWELLYNVDGGDIDWMYNEYHVIPYVIEINASAQGFQPPYSWRQPTVEKLRAAWQHLLHKLDGSGVRGIIRDSAGRTVDNATITVQNLASKDVDPIHWQSKPDGTFHMVLAPGMYNLTFRTPKGMAEEEVIVGDERINLDINL